jgi:hypothetical protein
VDALILQQLPRFATEIDIRGVDRLLKRYDLPTIISERTMCAGIATFVVDVADTVNRVLGPRVPQFAPTEPEDEPEEMLVGTVESSHVKVTKFEDEEEP